MSEKNCPTLHTKSDFKGLYTRYGFTQSERGVSDMLNDELITVATKLTKQAMLQSEHEKHSGLNENHAKTAIDMTPIIPKGVYQ